ncbi:unknown [Firmicutes bacterium CAG:170]|nr:unknown [Firmicutes bacterium CAG:170]
MCFWLPSATGRIRTSCRAASRKRSAAASGTRRRAASGRRSGRSGCRSAISPPCGSPPTPRTAACASPCSPNMTASATCISMAAASAASQTAKRPSGSKTRSCGRRSIRSSMISPQSWAATAWKATLPCATPPSAGTRPEGRACCSTGSRISTAACSIRAIIQTGCIPHPATRR